MKLKMLRPTYWEGQRLKPGDTITVAETVGARWERAGIAEKVKEPPKKGTAKE